MIPILVLAVFLLLSVLSVIAMVVVRPHYHRGVSPSPESKVTPLGTYRRREVRRKVTRADIQEGMKRANERMYVKEPGEEMHEMEDGA